MLVKICVPSKARAQLFHDKTFQILRYYKQPWSVFVDEQDYTDYAMAGIPEKNIVYIPKNNMGFGYALNFIREHCLAIKATYCWKMDDDVQHCYTHSRVDPKVNQAASLIRCVNEVLKPAILQLGVKLGGLSFPHKLFHMKWDKYTHVNKMLDSIYIIRADTWFTPLESKGYNEEPFASAYLLTKGLATLCTGSLAWSHDMSTLPGGLQSYNRVKEHAERYKLMVKTYPALMAMMQPQEYKQNSGVTFTVVDKANYNHRHSIKLPLNVKNSKAKHLLPSVLTAIQKLTGQSCVANS